MKSWYLRLVGWIILWLVSLAALFFRDVWTFEEYDVWIVGSKRVEHAVEGGRVGPFVGVVTEDDTRCVAGVCAHEANVEASI